MTIDSSARRGFLKQVSALLALPFGVSAGRAATSGQAPLADTRTGKVRGENVDGINAFKGIPYGGDTSGKNRFMPPTKPTPWKGVRESTNWGHVAPQPLAAGRVDYVRMIEWLDQPGGQSEDCLVLNVWTPGIKDGAKRPVLVSFHGGGFTTGTSGNPGYNGHPLAKFGNVVVVTINHRLGCLGYLHLADLAPEFATSGTAGMQDCVASLEWVRDNIENFGGDPGNVMIFGQSGGGAKVSNLLAMPSAKGLFHRAAIQSGAALRSVTRDTAAKAAERMVAQIGIDKSRVRELQGVPVEMMIAAQASLGVQTLPVTFGPVVDGAVLPNHPFDPAAPEISAAIPLIVSSTLHDAALGRTDFSLDAAGLQAQVKALAGNDADRIIAAYTRAYPGDNPFKLLCAMLTDRGGRRNAITLSERKAAQHAAPVYMYQWNWPSPGYGGKFGPCMAPTSRWCFTTRMASLSLALVPRGVPWPTKRRPLGWPLPAPAIPIVRRCRSGPPIPPRDARQ
jgi:para-nitrobenzyl esterase